MVGIGNTSNRIWDYTASSDPSYGGGGAHQYLAFVRGELKVQIDRLYQTSPGRLDTGIAGSSLGGLAAAYAGLWMADAFGLVGVLSPSTWWNNGELIGLVAANQGAGLQPVRVYLDSGDSGPSQDDVAETRALAHAFQATPGLQLQYLVGHGDAHDESAWARRLPGALRFLLGPRPALPWRPARPARPARVRSARLGWPPLW